MTRHTFARASFAAAASRAVADAEGPHVIARIASDYGTPIYLATAGIEAARVRVEGAGPWCLYCGTYECPHVAAVRQHIAAHTIGA